MSLYEVTILLRQDLTQQQVEGVASDFTKVIESFGGKVEKLENWGLRTLSYRINKNRKAHYIFLGVNSPATAVQEIDRQCRINEDVLRILTVKVEELDKEPSVILSNKHSKSYSADMEV